MSLVGRICGQFQGLLRSTKAMPAIQMEQCLKWNQTTRCYTRKANLVRKAKKAEERAQKKANKKVRVAFTARPFPVDACADKEPSTDNVWFKHLHPFKKLTFEEAIDFHRETVHETVLNAPSALVNVIVVLNLRTKKEGVNLDKVRGVFMPVHIFPAGRDFRVLALCKEKEDVEKALNAGAYSAGGLELIKAIEEGNLQTEEYDSVVAHTDVLTALTPIRGLLKTKFPRVSQGTMGRDIAAVVTKVKESRSYNLFRDSGDQSVGWVSMIVGTMDMSTEQLKENLKVFLSSILRQQPRSPDAGFITDVFVTTPSSDEMFALDRFTLLTEEMKALGKDKKEIIQTLIKEGQEEEEEDRKVAKN